MVRAGGVLAADPDGRQPRLRGRRALPVQRADGLGLRHDLHVVRQLLHARLGLHADAQGPYPHRHLLRKLVGAHAGHGRCGLLPAVLLPGDDRVRGRRLGLLLGVVGTPGAHGDESLDADRLAVQAVDSARHRPDADAGRLRIHQELHRGAPGRLAVSPEIIGLVALAVLFVAIFIGFPIAFTLIALALGVGHFALGDVAIHLMTLQVFSVMRDPTLASVPFFLFMGYLLEESGLIQRLFRGVQLLLAPVNGSLYLAVIITATIFAAATGIVGSSVTLLGVMAAPAM